MRNNSEAVNDTSCLHLHPHIFSRLETFAKSRGVSIDEALDQLLESEACRIGGASGTACILTKKQQEIMDELKAGLSIKEIAVQRGVSEGTVRTHICRMRRLLGCSDLLKLRYL
jgi:two-component system, NarL family, nitrate/nitrite response regulator NarL